MPFAVVQLTDPHIGATWTDDPSAALAAAVAAVGKVLSSAPDAVLVSGDIANTPDDGEYEQARELLDRFDAPVYVLPGNHDDREGLKRHFAIPVGEEPHLSYAVDLGPARLVCLDTQRPGRDGGQLDSQRLSWLERSLAQDEVTPTLLAMHHPPLVVGVPSLDAIAIPPDERGALAESLARHRQVHVIAAGHVHRAIIGELGGARVIAIPSTDVQLALDTEAPEIRLVREPACFAVHMLIEGRFVSHIQPISR
jgi:3',5'-cyclic-AMP phosphodiesterase